MFTALRAALGRGLWFLATLAGAVLLVQVLLWAAPGDPIDLLPNGDELRPALEAEWGLDQPLPIRSARYALHAAQGDLGTSLTVRPGTAVSKLVRDAAGRSAVTLSLALIVSVTLSLGLALITRGRRPVVRLVTQLLTVPPVFLLAYLLVLSINVVTWGLVQDGTIARPEWFALPDQASTLRSALAVGVLAVGSGSLGETHAALESALIRILHSPFVTATRARGAHIGPTVLHNLLPPILAVASRRVAFLLGGLVVVEKVLLLNGAGALLWNACLRRDYPLAMGLCLVSALAVSGAQLVADLARLALDPRLRQAQR
ncbi:MAG: ABC transporter permease [Oligoflexia bacterium]|nr:ABC transporter permease [Oligoflexia bacterium]